MLSVKFHEFSEFTEWCNNPHYYAVLNHSHRWNPLAHLESSPCLARASKLLCALYRHLLSTESDNMWPFASGFFLSRGFEVSPCYSMYLFFVPLNNYILIIHSPIIGHLGGFYLLVVMNHSVVNVHEFTSLCMKIYVVVFPHFGKVLRNEMSGSPGK